MMSILFKASLLFLLGAQSVSSTALDDYVWTPDENYKWVDMVGLERYSTDCIKSQKKKLILQFVF